MKKRLLPNQIAPVKAVPEEDMFDDWPILFKGGNSAVDGENWALVTDSVKGSELMDLEFPQDAKLDAEFIADLINAYREGKLQWVDAAAPKGLFDDE